MRYARLIQNIYQKQEDLKKKREEWNDVKHFKNMDRTVNEHYFDKSSIICVSGKQALTRPLSSASAHIPDNVRISLDKTPKKMKQARIEELIRKQKNKQKNYILGNETMNSIGSIKKIFIKVKDNV